MIVKYKSAFGLFDLTFSTRCPANHFPSALVLRQRTVLPHLLALGLVKRYLYLCVTIDKQNVRCCRPYAGDNSE